MRDNGKEDAVGCEITRKRTLGKRGGGADKRVGAHSRYQFFRCGKIGGGADKRWGALWRYSTVYICDRHCTSNIAINISIFHLGLIRGARSYCPDAARRGAVGPTHC